MKVFLQRIFATIAFISISVISLILAFTFIFILVIGMTIFYIINRLRGKSFSAKQYWQEHSTRARSKTQHFKTHYQSKYQSQSDNLTRPPESEVTDVDFREIK